MNEEWRLTKEFPRQLLTKPGILVTPSSEALPISYLLYFISKYKNNRKTRLINYWYA